MSRPEIISKLSFYLMDKEPLIYLFIINSDFIKDEWGILKQGEWEGYAGVSYQSNRVKFIYTDSFLKLPVKQLYFVLIHEAQHVFKHHLVGKGGIHDHFKNQLLIGQAEDGIINDEILEMKFLGLQPEPPTDAGGIRIPEDFKNHYHQLGKDAYTSPRLYAWWEKKKKPEDKTDFIRKSGYVKKEDGTYGSYGYDREDGTIAIQKIQDLEGLMKSAKGDKSAEGQFEYVPVDEVVPVVVANNNPQLMSDEETYDAEFIGYFDKNISGAEELKDEEESIIPQRVFVETMVKQADQMVDNNPALKAAQKLAGITEGNSLSGSVKDLLKSEVNWKKEFRQGLNIFMSDRGTSHGYKQSYITHLMNPRSRYGMLGKHRLRTTTKEQNYIIIAMDTSGSCFYDEYDKQRFFTEIDEIAKEMSFSKTGKVYMMMWDWRVTNENIYEYKVGDWKNYKLSGGGGTNPAAVFRHLDRRTATKGMSAELRLNEKETLFIKNKKELPMLLFLTDGYFYQRLHDRDLGMYKEDKKSIMFLTKSESYIPDEYKRVVYK